MIFCLFSQIIKTPEINVSNLRSNIFSALIMFDLFFLQPVLSGHLAIPRG